MGADPVAGLAVVVTLLDPLLEEDTGDGVVQVLAAAEAEGVIALTLDWLSFNILRKYIIGQQSISAIRDSHLNLDSLTAVWTGAPLEQFVALHEAVGDEVLVLQLDSWVSDQRHHSLVVDDDLAVARALDHLAGPLVHDLGGEVLRPARGAVQVAALKA